MKIYSKSDYGCMLHDLLIMIRRKYEIVKRVMRENKHGRILRVGDIIDINGHIGLFGGEVKENLKLNLKI